MISSRRSFLVGSMASLFAAPAVVRATSLMQIRGVLVPMRELRGWDWVISYDMGTDAYFASPMALNLVSRYRRAVDDVEFSESIKRRLDNTLPERFSVSEQSHIVDLPVKDFNGGRLLFGGHRVDMDRVVEHCDKLQDLNYVELKWSQQDQGAKEVLAKYKEIRKGVFSDGERTFAGFHGPALVDPSVLTA